MVNLARPAIDGKSHRPIRINDHRIERARGSILPLSCERRDHYVALREWHYSGAIQTISGCCGTCDLCHQEGLRYRFEILNRFTCKHLWVDSEFVKRFRIKASGENGKLLDEESTARQVDAEKRAAEQSTRHQSVVRSLLSLTTADDQFEIKTFEQYLGVRGAFTPKQLAFLVWRFEVHGIDFSISHFKVSIRRPFAKRQLMKMPDWKLAKIWAALSPSQRRLCQENRP
jgi:hypothetical protein